MPEDCELWVRAIKLLSHRSCQVRDNDTVYVSYAPMLPLPAEASQALKQRGLSPLLRTTPSKIRAVFVRVRHAALQRARRMVRVPSVRSCRSHCCGQRQWRCGVALPAADDAAPLLILPKAS